MNADDHLRAVQNAALERALTDGDVRNHLELVGALEVARGERTAVEDGTFAAAMACLVAVAALPEDPLPPTTASPPTPGGDENAFLDAGADVAVERYGDAGERLARRAGVSLP